MQKPNCVLGLATGSTPVGAYEQLVEWYKQGDLSFKEVSSVNLDEYLGLTGDHPQSYRYFMNENLFNHVSIDPANTMVPNGLVEDADAMCAAYEAAIEAMGGIDIQLLGIGHDGHIGFNEPCDHFPAATHEVELEEITRQANKRFFNSIDEVPTAAYTMGCGTVMAARKVLLIATGKDKAEIVKQSFFGPVTPMVPASILQFHPDVTVIVDEAAASLIQ
jgi:glucosamine-6-phosphate deaminase